MEDILTFEQVRHLMDDAYTDYLVAYEPFKAEEDGLYKTYEQDAERLDDAHEKLWQSVHQVLSNALHILNDETGDYNEHEFEYEIPEQYRGNARLKTSAGRITKIGTVPTDGIVWLVNDTGEEFYDDNQKIKVWELYCVAIVLDALTEPVPYIPD